MIFEYHVVFRHIGLVHNSISLICIISSLPFQFVFLVINMLAVVLCQYAGRLSPANMLAISLSFFRLAMFNSLKTVNELLSLVLKLRRFSAGTLRQALRKSLKSQLARNALESEGVERDSILGWTEFCCFADMQ